MSFKFYVIVILLIVIFYCQSVLSQDKVNDNLSEPEFGRNGYIEYISGNLPLVFSAPHGGYIKGDDISDRTRSTLIQDKRTLELTLEIRKAIYEETGKYPYVIINRLHRVKLDPNREYEVAVQGDSVAAISYNQFHEFIETAEKDIFEKWGTGFYVDVHAHPDKYRKIELGYLLEAELLFFPDEELNDEIFIEKSSIRNLIKSSKYSFTDIIRGDVSFGALLEKGGYPSTPSPDKPEPQSIEFFSGGYNTFEHGAPGKYNFNGLQIETYWDGLRDTEENRIKFSKTFVKVLIEYLQIHYNLDLRKL